MGGISGKLDTLSKNQLKIEKSKVMWPVLSDSPQRYISVD